MRRARTYLLVPLAAVALTVTASATPKPGAATAKEYPTAATTATRHHTSTSRALLPKHKPFGEMTLQQLAAYQRLTLQRDAYTIAWWKANRSRALASATPPSYPLCLGGRMPRAVCWHYKHRGWTRPLYRRTLAALTPPAPALPYAFWNCVASGYYPGRGQVSSGEGGATSVDPTGTYFGMYQMDWGFMRHWGADMLRKYGGRPATAWSVTDQTVVAERGFHGQGPMAWPNTAPPCLGLR